MQSFIKRKNIENYRKLLELTVEEADRGVLLKLLKDEEAKLGLPTKARRNEQHS